MTTQTRGGSTREDAWDRLDKETRDYTMEADLRVTHEKATASGLGRSLTGRLMSYHALPL